MMPSPRRHLPRTLALAACALVSACSVLEPRPDGSRYFLLRPLAEPSGSPALDDLVLGLGPVELPDYLDRIEMLDLVGAYELRYSSAHRWVEPLGEQVRTILADNLRVMLRPDAVVAWPWFEAERVGLQVEVVFDAIRLDDAGVWTGSAEWVVRDPAAREALERRETVFELGRDSVPPEVLAEELSRQLRILGAEIAEGVRRHHPR